MLFATGCRRGELIALTFDDWNMSESTLLIKHNRVYGENGSVIKKPKMEKIRTIYVGTDLNRVIAKEKIKYKEKKLKYGPGFMDSNLMVCQDNGKWYEPDAISVKWKRFLRDNNLPLVGMHSCRHAFATLGIAECVDIASLSRHLGHSQI